MLFHDFSDGIFDFGNGVLRFDFEVIMRIVLAEFKVIVATVQIGKLNTCHRKFSAFSGFARICGGKRLGGAFRNNHVFYRFGKIPCILCVQNGDERNTDSVFLVNALCDSLGFDGVTAELKKVEVAVDFLELKDSFPNVDNCGLRFGEDYRCFGFRCVCCGCGTCGKILHQRFAIKLSVRR